MNEKLIALLDGEWIGVAEQGRGGDITFTYDDAWRDDRASYPVSLSMPLARKTHPDATARRSTPDFKDAVAEFLEK